MQNRRTNSGFTLIELLVVVLVFFVITFGGYYLLLRTICKGNFWFTEEGVMRELRAERQKVSALLKTERNILDPSVITVREDGEAKKYYLDSDLLFNYNFSDQPE